MEILFAGYPHHIAHGFNRGYRVMRYGCEMAIGVCDTIQKNIAHVSHPLRPHG